MAPIHGRKACKDHGRSKSEGLKTCRRVVLLSVRLRCERGQEVDVVFTTQTDQQILPYDTLTSKVQDVKTTFLHGTLNSKIPSFGGPVSALISRQLPKIVIINDHYFNINDYSRGDTMHIGCINVWPDRDGGF